MGRSTRLEAVAERCQPLLGHGPDEIEGGGTNRRVEVNRVGPDAPRPPRDGVQLLGHLGVALQDHDLEPDAPAVRLPEAHEAVGHLVQAETLDRPVNPLEELFVTRVEAGEPEVRSRPYRVSGVGEASLAVVSPRSRPSSVSTLRRNSSTNRQGFSPVTLPAAGLVVP